MQIFDSILFDFDGVLADTEPIHYQCWLEVLGPFGIQPSWEYYQYECIGISDRMMIERLAAMRQPPAEFDEIWPRYREKQALFRAKLEHQSPFLAETTDLIRELSQSYKLAVVSSSGRTEVEPPLVRADIRPCFETLVCGKEAQNLKPAPDPYLLAAKLVGARNPLVVEDSDAGTASGLAAGFEVLRVPSAERMAQELRKRLSLI